MKKHIPAATLAVGIIALCAILGGCNGEGQTSSVQTTTTSVTTSATVKSTTASQTSPQTASSASSITTVTTKETTTTSAVTTTKQTAPPKTEPPATVAPVTDPPQTKPPQTEPSPPYIITPTADGVKVYSNGDALIDASNSSQGYLMIKLKKAMSGSYRILVNADDINVRYTFQLNNSGNYEVIPITEGSGSYTVSVLKVTSAGKGTVMFKQALSVSVSDSFLPFLTPNQFCMYNSGSSCVALSSTLCGGNKDTIAKTAAIYDYVINNISYVSTAENGANGYIPLPDTVLANKSGICFDYASLMSAMLRSQRIPTKLDVGYSGEVYHAWISCYVDEVGWVDGIIKFDGRHWSLMDPTLAASNSAANVKKYVGDGSNYTTKYTY